VIPLIRDSADLILRSPQRDFRSGFPQDDPGYYLPARLATAAGGTFAVAPDARDH